MGCEEWTAAEPYRAQPPPAHPAFKGSTCTAPSWADPLLPRPHGAISPQHKAGERIRPSGVPILRAASTLPYSFPRPPGLTGSREAPPAAPRAAAGTAVPVRWQQGTVDSGPERTITHLPPNPLIKSGRDTRCSIGEWNSSDHRPSAPSAWLCPQPHHPQPHHLLLLLHPHLCAPPMTQM